MMGMTKRLRAIFSAGLFFVCVSVWAGHQPDHEGERLTPEQVGGEKRMSAILAEARALAQRGLFDAAVRNYVHVFNYGRGNARLEIIRLALVPQEIAALGEKFPPALQALREEVRVRAGLVLNHVAGTDEILELISLNRALDQPQRSLELYDQLKRMGERARATRLLMRAVMSQELLDARRFDELDAELVVMARQISARLAALEAESEFSSAPSEFLAAQRASILNSAAQIYAALLGTQRDDVAKIIAERLLRVDSTASGYTPLVSAALRARREDKARQLMQRAEKNLQPDEFTALKKLMP